MTEVPATIGLTIRFLWAVTWRNFLWAIVPIFITGISVALLFMAIGLPDLANPLARLATLLVSLVIAVPVTRSVFGKQLGKYRLVAVLADETDQS